jgi:hypothetical protein
MKSVLLGALGALTVCIPLVVVLLVVPARAQSRATPTPDRRAALMREIDEYEVWYTSLPGNRLNLCSAQPNPAQYDTCDAPRQRFLTLHPTFARYLAWWQDTRARELPTSLIVQWETAKAPPDKVRDPAMIDRYLATAP